MKVLSSLVLLLIQTAAVFSQNTGTVSGIVNHDGKPVAGATVFLGVGNNFANRPTTLTNVEGKFAFERVPPGTYSVWAYFNIDNERLKRQDRAHLEKTLVVTVADGETQTVTLDLVAVSLSSNFSVRELVTISANAEQAIEQVSKTVNFIDGQEMRDRADFSFIDTVRTIPGFRVQQLGGFGRTASIKSRGLRNQDTAVLVDGIRFRDPGSITGDATPFLSDLTLTSVSRIEVLRGSGSSLYGTNAVGGTIDFQTPGAKSGVHGQVGGAFGGLGLGRFRGNLSYGTDDNKFGVSGAVSRTAYTKGIDGEDNAGNTNFQSRVDYKPFSTTDISARFFVSDANVRLNVSPDTLGAPRPSGTIVDARDGINFIPDQNDPDSIQDSRFFSGQFSANHAVNSALVISGYYQGLVTKRSNEDGTLGPGFQSAFTSSFGGTIHTANVHATWTPSSSNTFTGGYEFELERFRNAGSTPVSDEGSTGGTVDFWTRANQQSNTLYAQHRLGFLGGDLQFAGGVRAQWFSLGTPEFSEPDGPYADATLSDPPAAYTFDGSASYYISRTGTKFRTHVGNGYRAPSLYERFGTFFFFGSFFPQGNPGLKPERSLGIDAGVEQYLANQKVKLSATYFYTKVKDEITYLPTDDFGAPAYYNFDRHFSRGIETSIDIKPTRSTDLFASYTFTNSDIRGFRRPSIVTVASTDRAAFGIPKHQFTMVATQRFERFWVTFDLLATSSYLAPVFSSEFFTQSTYRFDGNLRGDLTSGYTFPLRGEKFTLRLFGTIENMFDNEYFENGFRTPGMNGRVGVSFGF